MHDLHAFLCSKGEQTDFIALTIETPSLRNGPLWLSFRRISDFNVSELWQMFYDASQSSSESFETGDSLTINCSIVNGVAGQGRVRLTDASVRKSSILSIKNDDILCLPRSIATAYVYSLRGTYSYWTIA